MTVWYACSKEDLKLVVVNSDKPGCNALFSNLEVSVGLDYFNLFVKYWKIPSRYKCCSENTGRCVYLQGTSAAMAILFFFSANILTLVLKVNCSKCVWLWKVLICYFLRQCLLFENFLTSDVEMMEFFGMPSNCVGRLRPGSLFEEELSMLFNLCSFKFTVYYF